MEISSHLFLKRNVINILSIVNILIYTVRVDTLYTIMIRIYTVNAFMIT